MLVEQGSRLDCLHSLLCVDLKSNWVGTWLTSWSISVWYLSMRSSLLFSFCSTLGRVCLLHVGLVVRDGVMPILFGSEELVLFYSAS